MGWRRKKHASVCLKTLNSQPFPSRITRHASRVQAITFDVGGTLIQPWPSIGHVYATFAARHGLGDISIENLNRQFTAAWKNLNTFNYSRSEWFDIVNQSFAGLTQTPLSEALFTDLYSHFGRAEAWRIFDDVIPALEFLRLRDLKLGIVSNWDERLRPLLHELKLAHYFHTLVISSEAGACKPRLLFSSAPRNCWPAHPPPFYILATVRPLIWTEPIPADSKRSFSLAVQL